MRTFNRWFQPVSQPPRPPVPKAYGKNFDQPEKPKTEPAPKNEDVGPDDRPVPALDRYNAAPSPRSRRCPRGKRENDSPSATAPEFFAALEAEHPEQLEDADPEEAEQGDVVSEDDTDNLESLLRAIERNQKGGTDDEIVP